MKKLENDIIDYVCDNNSEIDDKPETIEGESDSKEFKHKVTRALSSVMVEMMDEETVRTDFSKVFKRTESKGFITFKQLKYVSAAILLLFIFIRYSGLVNTENVRYRTYKSRSDLGLRVNLPDGSKLFMKPNSVIRVPENFTDENRSCILDDGEMFCEIFHNPKSVFTMKSGEYTVKVLGTKFNFKSCKDDGIISTTLKEGKVKVKHGSDPDISFVLKPNQKVVLNKKDKSFSLKKYNDSVKIYWKENKISFSNAKLGDVMNNLSIYYNKDIVVVSDVGNEKISGTFKYKKLNYIITTLQKVIDFKTTNKYGKIIIN